MSMHVRGRPVLGAFAGLLFGLFLDLFLAVNSAVATNSVLLVVLPLAGLVLGIVTGWTGRLGRTPAPRPQSPAVAGEAPSTAE
jgi:hypothetical protein